MDDARIATARKAAAADKEETLSSSISNDAESTEIELSTVMIEDAHALANVPDLPRVEFEKGDTLFPRGPAKEKSLGGRGSVYSFLRSAEFK